MKTSPTGRALIEQREGRKLVAYHDTKGILTIGVGHTGRMSPPTVTAGMAITDAQCDAMLAADLAPVEAVIDRAVNVPMTQNEFDALASLGFNIGAAALETSSVVKRLNLGDVAGAADAFLLWNRPRGLAARRGAERAQFLGEDAKGRVVSHAPAVMKARAATLSTMAEANHAKAKAARSGAAALVAAGAATLATTHARHPWLALMIGGFMMAAGACAVLVAILGHRAARALADNAERQSRVAAGAGPTTTDIPASLEQ